MTIDVLTPLSSTRLLTAAEGRRAHATDGADQLPGTVISCARQFDRLVWRSDTLVGGSYRGQSYRPTARGLDCCGLPPHHQCAMRECRGSAWTQQLTPTRYAAEGQHGALLRGDACVGGVGVASACACLRASGCACGCARVADGDRRRHARSGVHAAVGVAGRGFAHLYPPCRASCIAWRALPV